MILKNFESLAKTPLRRDALEIIEAGYESISIETIFENSLSLDHDRLTIGPQSFDLTQYEDIYVVGVGKGSSLAAKHIEHILGVHRIKSGIVIDITKRRLKKIRSYAGTHPLPSQKNIKATNQMVHLLKQTQANDLVIALICGGGSALACQPGGLTCLELQFISSVLLRAGATIQEINTVRKHVSLFHGGHMAAYAYPSTVASLIISDVPGDDLSMVSSGPTVMDATTRNQAQRIIKKYGLPNLQLLETPKDKRYFAKVHNILIAHGRTTLEAMKSKARALGYKPRVYSTHVNGLANHVGPTMAKAVKPGEALIACGETEVIVSHPGKGGRNQDLALSAIGHLPAHSVIISAASDGKDNVPVAGAIADSVWSVAQCKRKKINPHQAVEANRSYKALRKLHDHLHINKVTANVSDFMLVLRDMQ